MGLTIVLRGFKVPVAVLDRFLEANGIQATFGYPPFYHRPNLDAGSQFLRTKLGATGGDAKIRIFIPQKEGHEQSTYAYVAYAWVMVHAQRKLELGADLPETSPPGFGELRAEVMGYANAQEDKNLLWAAGIQEKGGEDLAAALYVIVGDDAWFLFEEPYVRKVCLA